MTPADLTRAVEYAERLRDSGKTGRPVSAEASDLLGDAVLHLSAALRAPLPDALAAIEARAESATLVPWTEAVRHYVADVPALLAGIRAQGATIRERDAEIERLRAEAADRGKLGEGWFDHGG